MRIKIIKYQKILLLILCLQLPVETVVKADDRSLMMNARFGSPSNKGGSSQQKNEVASNKQQKITDLSEVLNEFTQAQNIMKEKIYTAQSIGHITKLGITGAMATTSLLTPVGKLGSAVAGQLLKDGVDLATDSLVSHWEQKTENVLEQGLIKYRETHSKKQLEELAHLDAKTIYNNLFGDEKIFQNETYLKMSEKERSVYHNFLFKTIADSIAKNEIQDKINNARTQEFVNDKFNEVSNELSQMTMWGVSFQKEIFGRINTIQSQTEDIVKDAKNIVSGIKSTQNASRTILISVEQMQEFMFGQMSPKQQLQALNNNWLSQVKGEEREELEKTAKVLSKRIELNENIDKFTGALGNLSQIGKNLRLDPKMVQTIDQVNKTIKIGQDTINTLASGNYLGVICAISGLFGGGSGEDPAVKRHQAIMEGINKILQQQSIMDEKLDTLLQGQKYIIKSQEVIYDEIVSLHKDLFNIHSDLVDSLNKIEIKLDNVNQLVRTQLEKEPNICFSFLHKTMSDLGGPYRIDSIPNYEKLKNYFDENKSEFFNSCLLGLDTLYSYIDSNPNQFHPLFLLKHYRHSEDSKRMEIFLENSYNPIYKRHIVKNQSIEEFKEPLLTPAVLKYTYLLLEFEPFLLVVDNKNELLTQEKLDTIKLSAYPIGENLLTKAQKLVETAISQQAFLAGITILDTLLLDLESDDLSVRKNLIESLLRYNAPLATNLFTKYLNSIAQSKGLNISHLIDLIRNQSFSFLNWNLNNRFDFIVQNGSIKAILRANPLFNVGINTEDLIISIAEDNILEKNALVYWNEMSGLIHLRDQIINRRTEYLYWQYADGEKIRILSNIFKVQ